ncbi:MAG: glycosyltransferase [Candidatus Moranbacteria bacterium]|nr:glycosyltransferase [Candidatus Moranbacteria bacterium]
MGIFSKKCANPKYSFITVNYRSATALGRMFRSFPPDFFTQGEFIIINNDKEESLLLQKMFQKIGFVRILETKENIGFACACNRGVQAARGDIVFFLNPDVRFLSAAPASSWKQDFFGNEPIIMAPILLRYGHEEPWSSGRIVSPWGIFLQNIFPFAKIWAFFSRKSLGWVSGAAFAIRKTDFDSLNGFDEKYFLYYEDVDFCRRAKGKGLEIRRNDMVYFSHRGGASHIEGKEKQKKYYYASQDRYIQKYYGPAWLSVFRFCRFCRLLFF